jgi:methylmalonyl-CoA/ethylmalonyl-CoA epimerase
MIIDHICFEVNDIKKSISYWETVFEYKQLTEIIENSRQEVRVSFLGKENSITIKLIEPIGKNQLSPNINIRSGNFHHLCFKCQDVNQKIEELKKKGMLILVPPQPGEAFSNNNIAFLLAGNGLRIELIDTDEKAGLLNTK